MNATIKEELIEETFAEQSSTTIIHTDDQA